MIVLSILKALVLTAVFSLLFTPADFKIAQAVGAVDIPKDGRRMHKNTVPRLGGFSIFLAFLIFSMIYCKDFSQPIFILFFCCMLIVALGIIDDCISLSARLKLAVQFIISFIAAYLGGFGGWLGIFWLVTLTNAHNFIDGLDGLCVGTSFIEAISLGILLHIQGDYSFAIMSFIIAGACLGFYPYNRRSAKIFMGDSGSTFLGFTLSALSVKFLTVNISLISFFTMCLIFALPLFDISFAVLRRLIKRKSPFSADRSHLHHLLCDKLLEHGDTSLLLRAISCIFCCFGISLYCFFI